MSQSSLSLELVHRACFGWGPSWRGSAEAGARLDLLWAWSGGLGGLDRMGRRALRLGVTEWERVRWAGVGRGRDRCLWGEGASWRSGVELSDERGVVAE